jgi:hypothetical protein
VVKVSTDLVRLAQRWANRIGEILSTKAGVTDFCPSREKQVRLLNWLVWCKRYHVQPEWIAERLLAYFEKHRRPTKPGNLGLNISVLTGPRAQEILEEAIRREYPHNENTAMHRNRLQRRMLEMPAAFKLAETNTLLENVKLHRDAAARWRKRYSQAKKKFNRPWRGNPWR